jgi:hypothetical protein
MIKVNMNFPIISSEKLSFEFLRRSIFDFESAAVFIRNLPYGRNANKQNLETVFSDGCGTCSTKHALLKQLAIENDQDEIKLFIGLFKMNGVNTPEVRPILRKNHLEYIPEAHCYLKHQGVILDCTKANSKPSDFIDDLIEEMEISPDQITDYKINYHKNYLKTWLMETGHELPLDDLWRIREACIQSLAGRDLL